MSIILTKLATYTATMMDKKALSAEYVAQMMYKSPTHKKEIYDIATKALKGGKGTVIPKHPLVEKKLTKAFTEAMNPLDGMVYPVVKKAEDAPTTTSKWEQYRTPGYLEDMSDAEIDAYVDNYYKTTTHRIPLAYKAINELMAKYDNNGKDGNARRFKGMKR